MDTRPQGNVIWLSIIEKADEKSAFLRAKKLPLTQVVD